MIKFRTNDSKTISEMLSFVEEYSDAKVVSIEDGFYTFEIPADWLHFTDE